MPSSEQRICQSGQKIEMDLERWIVKAYIKKVICLLFIVKVTNDSQIKIDNLEINTWLNC